MTIEPDISLVAALWHFTEDGGSAEEFRELGQRVRAHGDLYDAAPTLLVALETVLRCMPGANEPDLSGRPWLKDAVAVTASVRGLP